MSDNYFIKCEHCNFLNPFKTEFVTFCSQCGKKLGNNFPDWHKKNPEKTIRDFKNEVAVLKTDAEPEKKNPVQRKSRSFRPLIFILVILLAVAVYSFFLTDISGIFLPGKADAELLTSKWERVIYGKYGVTLSSPEKLKSVSPEYSVEAKPFIQDAESYLYRPSKKFRLNVTGVLFKEGVQLSMQGAVSGFASTLINTNDISHVEFTHSSLNSAELQGELIEGTYIDEDEFMRFQCAIYIRNSNLWQVLVSYPDKDDIAKKIAEKMMESLEINYNVKTI